MFSTFISSESKMTASKLPIEKFEPTEPLLGGMVAAVAGLTFAHSVAGWFNTLRVEPGVKSFSKAVIKARKEGYTNILLLNGIHDEQGEMVHAWGIGGPIDTRTESISISGESRDECIVLGGLYCSGRNHVQGYPVRLPDVHVSNLTLKESKSNGVEVGWGGASIHLKNICVEKSEGIGVMVRGSENNTMTDCNVSGSKKSGLRVEGDGIMTIDGNATIHGNCTGGPGTIYTDEDYRKPNYKNDDPRDNGYYYDLDAYSSSSSIHFVEPLGIGISLGIDSNNGGRGTFAIIDKDGKININATKNIWSKRITN
tara:strand:+ start:4849 stop:5784 length:936 start_codon:yes stop_codon:yes gene_type:complete